jgi:PAS domain S-box-containing protein
MSREFMLTGVERTFGQDEIIVSKTDLKGRITYANGVFQKIYGGTEVELMGKPHNLVRHPAMPKVVFKLLWDTLGAGHEIFAYVVNRAKNGDHYWVFAHVTPSRDSSGNVVGYHSNRRLPNKRIVSDAIEPLYRTLLDIEAKTGGKAGMEASEKALFALLKEKGVEYDRFIFSLGA